ncbi:MAG TPA: CoA transferase, partial [Gammaproteobacteria bacterium]|nr:CoA transferase [Gammaproteobacteria bacterium]
MPGALDGYRILDLTINVLGPLATQTLGDMGADVIKVEQLSGDDVRYIGPARHDGMSAFFLNVNRNKRSISLNLKSKAGKEALQRLIKTADVFVHSVRAKSMEKLG